MLKVYKGKKRGRKRGEKRSADPINKSCGFRVDSTMFAFLRGLENTNAFIRELVKATPEYQAYLREKSLEDTQRQI